MYDYMVLDIFYVPFLWVVFNQQQCLEKNVCVIRIKLFSLLRFCLLLGKAGKDFGAKTSI